MVRKQEKLKLNFNGIEKSRATDPQRYCKVSNNRPEPNPASSPIKFLSQVKSHKTHPLPTSRVHFLGLRT
jgi:hypothetical protein